MRITCGRIAYPSDLTDAEWERLKPFIPDPLPGGRPLEIERREIVNAILYQLRSGGAWRLLPHDFPAWRTVYGYFRLWQQMGIWQQIMDTLRQEVRVQMGRDPTPSAGVLDSQSIKGSAIRGSDTGYDAGKKNQGPQTSSVRRHARIAARRSRDGG
ncbi:IS5 family transposase [Dictyobacter kobayashii]|uniref:Insertion element IS402-like domain-containing protein n=1 Tax=Dictyobacter kobayashii TaxID=2014872 RepID=A0A402AVM5_9CHLR|nr:IS5 family transposase [Dictyobacter kobayashii]GCE23158.1 hypothetical protein KDK_69580 [Dictyobacter kobayashii]